MPRPDAGCLWMALIAVVVAIAMYLYVIDQYHRDLGEVFQFMAS
jgi:hypothetical protein